MGSGPGIGSQGEVSASQASNLARFLLDAYTDVDDYHYYKYDCKNNFNDNVEDTSNYSTGDNAKNDGAHECAILDSDNIASITLDGGNKTGVTLYKMIMVAMRLAQMIMVAMRLVAQIMITAPMKAQPLTVASRPLFLKT